MAGVNARHSECVITLGYHLPLYMCGVLVLGANQTVHMYAIMNCYTLSLSHLQVPHETVRQILAPLTIGSGWEFKLPTDQDFIHK